MCGTAGIEEFWRELKGLEQSFDELQENEVSPDAYIYI